jgi:8-oxo-dGTP diphosphatase
MTEKLEHIALGIVRRDEEVLLIERRQKENGDNKEVLNWVFPGGKIEIDENPFTAAEREVSEETGYIVQATKQLDARRHPSFPVHVHYIACALSERYPAEANDRAVMQVKWIAIAKLGIYITSSLNDNVAEYLASKES